MSRPIIAITLCLMCLSFRSAVAQIEKESFKLVTKTYDCRTLIAVIPDYPLDSSILPAAAREQLRREQRGNQPPVEGDPGRTGESIAKLVQDTVATETWRDNGGTLGTIKAVSGSLVVTQTEANHAKVAELLDALRGQYLATVRVEATWVLLADKDLAALPTVEGHNSLVMIPAETLKTATVYSRAQTTAFNGQIVHMASMSQKSYVADVSPVVGAAGIAYDVRTALAPSGVALQIKAQFDTDRKTAVLDLFNIVTESPESAKVDFRTGAALPAGAKPEAGKAEGGAIQLMNGIHQQFRTTVQIPLGVNVLIGGGTIEADAKANPPRQLYLVLRVEADKK